MHEYVSDTNRKKRYEINVFFMRPSIMPFQIIFSGNWFEWRKKTYFWAKGLDYKFFIPCGYEIGLKILLKSNLFFLICNVSCSKYTS